MVHLELMHKYSLAMVTMVHFKCSVLNYWTDIKRGIRTSKFNTAEKNAALKTARNKMRKGKKGEMVSCK